MEETWSHNTERFDLVSSSAWECQRFDQALDLTTIEASVTEALTVQDFFSESLAVARGPDKSAREK